MIVAASMQQCHSKTFNNMFLSIGAQIEREAYVSDILWADKFVDVQHVKKRKGDPTISSPEPHKSADSAIVTRSHHSALFLYS